MGQIEVSAAAGAARSSVIGEEVARFDALGESWWDPKGPMAPLHRLNPLRIDWAVKTIRKRLGREEATGAPLAGLSLLDIGCGAGLFAESMARLGADVTGVDPAQTSIAVARRHAQETGARLAYRAATAEDLAREGRRFDVVAAMEVVEHVADPSAFVAVAASLLKPDGVFIGSTLNRTFKSFAFAIVGAEYVLRWLEPGTHRWEQFVTPREFADAARGAGLVRPAAQGVVYDPLSANWRLSSDLAVNYLFAAERRSAKAD